MNTIQIVTIILAGSILIWDGILYFRNKQTISQVWIIWAKNNPFLPFAMGLLMGHLWL